MGADQAGIGQSAVSQRSAVPAGVGRWGTKHRPTCPQICYCLDWTSIISRVQTIGRLSVCGPLARKWSFIYILKHNF